MIKFSLKFSDSNLSLLQQSSHRAGMLMTSGWQGYKIFKSVIIPETIDMVNLPTFWNQTMGFFPNQNMLQDLMLFTCSGMVTRINPDITSRSFPSSTFPVGVFFPSHLIPAVFKAECRLTVNQLFAYWARMFMSFFILPLVFLHIESHIGIIPCAIGDVKSQPPKHPRQGL